MAQGLIERMKGAAMLDIQTYEEVEHDQTATGQAALVVFLGAVASGIGASGTGVFEAVFQSGWVLIGWGIWAGITYLVGSRLFEGTADWGELLRTLGFAQAPNVLLLLGIVPFLPGGLIRAVSRPCSPGSWGWPEAKRSRRQDRVTHPRMQGCSGDRT